MPKPWEKPQSGFVPSQAPRSVPLRRQPAERQTLQILQLPEMFVCFLVPGWEGVGREKELSRNLGQKGQCWCSRLGLKVPKPACGGVKMLPLKESLQAISSAAGWHKLIVPWRALKSRLQLSPEPPSDLQTFSQTLVSV